MNCGLLLLDSGNSSLKWQMLHVDTAQAALSGDLLGQIVSQPVRAVANDRLSVGGLLEAWSDQTRIGAASAPEDWRMSWLSVGPAAARRVVSQAWRAWTGRRVPQPWTPQRLLHVRTPVGLLRLVNGYRMPGQLGADRWLASLGLVAAGIPSGSRIQMIVSAGTATTIDLIRLTGSDSPEAVFLGGWILPGIRLMSQSLRSSTRDLDRLMGSMNFGPDSSRMSAVPCDSASAIHQGILLAQAGCVHELARRYGVGTIWLHGGHADVWHEGLRFCGSRAGGKLKVMHQPRLVFAGLASRALASRLP